MKRLSSTSKPRGFQRNTFWGSVTPQGQLSIPQQLREHLGIEPGDKLLITEHDGMIHAVPLRGLEDMAGWFRSDRGKPHP